MITVTCDATGNGDTLIEIPVDDDDDDDDDGVTDMFTVGCVSLNKTHKLLNHHGLHCIRTHKSHGLYCIA